MHVRYIRYTCIMKVMHMMQYVAIILLKQVDLTLYARNSKPCSIKYSQTCYCGHSEIRTPLYKDTSIIRTVNCGPITI